MSADSDRLEDNILLERLLRSEPGAERLLQRLLERAGAGGIRGAFARIEAGRCSGCNLAVASAKLQQAKLGGFINCAACSRFLYVESH